MKKSRLFILIGVILLSLALTGAVLASVSNQESGPGQIDNKPDAAESASTGPFAAAPDGILSTTYVYTNSISHPIADNSCFTTSLTVPDIFNVGDLNVGVWITHTYRSDLDLWLTSPNGTEIDLLTDADSGADNLNVLLDDSSPYLPDAVNHTAPPPYYYAWWQPDTPLAQFFGEAGQGEWVMEVCDDAGGDTGVLNQWTLFFTTDFVGIDPPTQSAKVCKGNDVVYDLTLYNATGVDTAFDLTYISVWPHTGPVVSPVLADGESWEFQVSVHIPWTANAGDSDMLTVTVSGGGETDSATMTTTASIVEGWQDYANSPVDRGTRAPSVVYWDGKLYKIGGYGYIGTTGAARPWLDIYDIATDTWSQGTDMDAGRYWIDCEAIDLTGTEPKIYCAGGYLASAQSALYIYDINTNTWTTGTSLPANRYSYSSAVYNNKYYVIGGYTTTYANTMVVYDPVTNSWDSTLAPMAVARRYAQAGLIGNKIYVAGGYNPSYLSSAEVYDIGANTWSPIASMPSPWLNAADGVVNDRYLVLAGGSPSSTAGASNGALIYDSVTDSWDWLLLFNHIIYGAEGDFDGTNFWAVSGRKYEGGIYSNSIYTTKLVECDSTCTPVSGADFTWDPLIPWATFPATFEATVVAGSPAIYYDWTFGDGSSGGGQTVDYTYQTPGTYTVALTATNCDGANQSTANHDVTVILPPTISVDPTNLLATQYTDMVTTQTLEICNVGDFPLDWELNEAEALPPPPVEQLPSEPAVQTPEIFRLPDGSVDCVAYQNYTGFEPVEVAAACPVSLPENYITSPFAPTDIGYALEMYATDTIVHFQLNDFPGQTVIGTSTAPFYGMDFDPTAEVLYALNDTTDQLGTVDLTTGAFTALVPCPPGGAAANWTGLSIDPVTGVFYASTATDLYTIDPSTGISTLVGPFGTTLMIDIAVNMEGEMYGHDIGTDSIYSINTTTGVAALIGSTTYLANFAQGMDFDNDDGTLYIFLYQGSGANVYGTVNLTTGAVTPLSVSNPTGEFEGAIQIPGAIFDLPWVSEVPITGTIAGGACTNVTVSFDSTGLALGDYFGNFLISSNDPVTPELSVPVQLSVVEPEPDIVVSPLSLDATLPVGGVVTSTFTISNIGDAGLTWELSGGAPWFSQDPTSGSVPVDGSTDVIVTFDATGLTPGDYQASLEVISDDPDEPIVLIDVSLTVYGFADIVVTPMSLSMTLHPNETGNLPFTISNNGLVNLTWALGGGTSWHSQEPTSGTILPTESIDVVVTFDSTGLAQGVYQSSLLVENNDPDTPVVTVDITFTVNNYTFFLPFVHK